ncbi:hypothetical protein Taro_029857 [Colocasia esculenta]|uniref:C2H2-type domain-containing protein n=1 Tax=Colocasia esculenta TaxID=4460 RepID=A0A843VYG1_COLES|nr:hypothetical protein [Colocasia esculenta]
MAATTNSSSSVDNDYSHAIVKGKRTKRRRLRNYLPVPVPAAATPSTSSSSSAAASGNIDEEDMANCLILLAQGRALEEAGPKPEVQIEGEGGGDGGSGGGGGVSGRSERYTSRRLAEAATMTNGKVSFYVYECKTCNKCFPSFQALGGHRSSHKKIKLATLTAAEEKKPSEELGLHLGISTSYSHPNPLPNNTNASTPPAAHNNVNNSNNNINDINTSSVRQKVHECSICGAEFSSGQALGGHMRRHRAEPIPQGRLQEAKEKSILPLDLNLPAPADDDRGGDLSGPSFGFPPKRPLVFSPSSLVDCHY